MKFLSAATLTIAVALASCGPQMMTENQATDDPPVMTTVPPLVINHPADVGLEINHPADVPIGGYEPAVRTSPPPAPPITLPPNLPVIDDIPQPQETLPADLCANAQALRVSQGLPARFDALAYRESRCQNNVRTYCCYGIYQIYWSLITRDHRMQESIAACGASTLSDIYGETPEKRRANTCVAKALFDVSGYGAWATS